MIYGITYSDEGYKKSRDLCGYFLKHKGKADKVILYNRESIDKNFYNQHKDILDCKKGGGYYLWKPYIIYKTLKQINDGDYVLYTDAASLCLKNIKKTFISRLEKYNQDILAFATSFPEYNWTKPSLLKSLDYPNSFLQIKGYLFQFEAVTVCIKKTDFSLKVIKEWLDACSDAKKIKEDSVMEFPCIDHRYDQSNFSLVMKKNGIIPHKNLSNRYLYKNICGKVENFTDNSPDYYATEYFKIFSNEKYEFAILTHHCANVKFFELKVVYIFIRKLLDYWLEKAKRRL